MKRSKKKSRGNPLNGKTEPMNGIAHRDSKPSKGQSLGFGRDRARKYKGQPTPPTSGTANSTEAQNK